MRRSGAAALVLIAALASTCGKKGDPLPPLRRFPPRVADLAARRTSDHIDLTFTVPAANMDGSTPVALDRIEVYGLTAPAADPPATPAQLLDDPRNLIGRVLVRPADAAAGPDDRRPLPGERASLTDPLDPTLVSGGLVRYIAAVVVTGSGRGRQGPASDVLSVPIDPLPAAPETVTVSHSETTIRILWAPVAGAETTSFEVSRAGAAGESGVGDLVTAPATLNEVEMPIGAFGRENCFRVRALRATGPVTAEGAFGADHCITPVDTYPPPAPTGLRALQENASVTLIWNGVAASDLGGYVVLRGEGVGDNLQPLIRTPIGETTYRDAGVRAGTTYSYAVYAVDRAAAPNVSQLSNRETVTVR